MIVSFFEEFPTKNNLDKLSLITWHSKLYLAAKSRGEFDNLSSQVINKNVSEIVWWPVLSKKDGYWISPFSKSSALSKIFVESEEIPLMIDAELPLRYPFRFLHFHNFFKNRELIRKFIKNHKKVYTAEYAKITGEFFGLHFSPRIYGNKVIKMLYQSMHKFDLTKEISKFKQLYGDSFIPAFGTIAGGVLGNEPILQPHELEWNLRLAKKLRVKEVIIFRLGGLNKEYIKVIKMLVSHK